MLPEAIHALLVADADVKAGLATYDFGDPTPQPAVFTLESGIPDDAAYPCVFVQTAASGDFGCRDKRGGEQDIDVTLYGPRDRANENGLEATALAIWRCVNRADLCLTGFSPWGCLAMLPARSQDPGGFPAYRIAVRVRVLEV